jgi:hypothetical protein
VDDFIGNNVVPQIEEGKITMRAFDCVPPDDAHKDTIHFEAENDELLVAQAVKHVEQYHSALGIGEAQLRDMVAKGAYDAEPVARA